MGDQARALAAAWGLLSGDNNNYISEDFDVSEHEAVADAKKFGAAVTGGSRPSPSPQNAASGVAPAGGARPAGNNRNGGGTAEKRGDARREDWAPLWEAMAMLSVPSVSVGAVGAGECLIFFVFVFLSACGRAACLKAAFWSLGGVVFRCCS